MAPHDELRHAGTKYVLADPGRSYIAYSDQSGVPLGLKSLSAWRVVLEPESSRSLHCNFERFLIDGHVHFS